MSLRAAGIEAFGGGVTRFELPEPPPLEADEVLIEVKAAGVANWDEFVRTGGWDVGRVLRAKRKRIHKVDARPRRWLGQPDPPRS